MSVIDLMRLHREGCEEPSEGQHEPPYGGRESGGVAPHHGRCQGGHKQGGGEAEHWEEGGGGGGGGEPGGQEEGEDMATTKEGSKGQEVEEDSS